LKCQHCIDVLYILVPLYSRINRYPLRAVRRSPLGLFLAFAGFRKLHTNWEAGWAVYRGNGFSPAEYRNTAVIEVIGGLGTVFSRMKSFGAVILISMIAWVEMGMKRGRKAERTLGRHFI
jgi:hypothetical protein